MESVFNGISATIKGYKHNYIHNYYTICKAH